MWCQVQERRGGCKRRTNGHGDAVPHTRPAQQNSGTTSRHSTRSTPLRLRLGMNLLGRHLEMAIEKVRRSAVRLDPVAIEQEVVNLVGEDELLEFNMALAKACD